MRITQVMFLGMIFLVLNNLSFGGEKYHLQKKPLPLDRVPNVVMKTPNNSRYVHNQIIVKLNSFVIPAQVRGKFGAPAVDEFVRRYSVQSVARIFPHHKSPSRQSNVDLSKFFLLKFASPMDAFKVAEELSRLPDVQYAEPVFIHKIDDMMTCTPQDTFRFQQWALNKIQTDTAWCISQGDTSIVIGIVDTGVQWDHPDLQPNIWIHSGEDGLDSLGGDKRANGVDDDNNGYVDDYHGWDFMGADGDNPSEDNNPSPTQDVNGHGTHVAGIASAATNNSIGISGVGYNCRILPLKASADNDNGRTIYGLAAFQGIIYAADMGAHVINLSWGSLGASQFEQDLINYATENGTLIVGAAGNDNSSEPIYPASYANVISVAATKNSDAKASYSNFGSTVDVCAPGGEAFNVTSVNVYSTYYPNTYALSAGTSMSAPHVAGLAGLVRSYFSSYTPLQVGEKIRISCDNIDGVNSGYINQLGKGRINALRALTFSSPSLRMVTIVTSDSAGGNNNGVLQPNEIFTITSKFKNYLDPLSSSAIVTLSSTDPYVEILSGGFAVGALGTLDSIDNSSTPFQVQVKSNAPPGRMVRFLLTMTDGDYSDFQIFTLVVNPTFATHDANKVKVTFSNNGKIGYGDYPTNSQGVGFIYPYPEGGNHLFEGGLLIGYSPTKIVNVVRDTLGGQDNDFSSSQIYNIVSPGSVSDQDGTTLFTDASAPTVNKVGVQVTMHSYAFKQPLHEDYVIVQYDVKNTTAGTLSNLFVGLFFDWDMLPDYATNKTALDSVRSLAYAWDDAAINPVYCGTRALDGVAGYRGLVNNTSIDLSRVAKFSWISEGIVPTDSIQDIHYVISSGPYTIPSNATRAVAFALIGGMDLADLQTNADAAQSKWDSIKTLVGVEGKSESVPNSFLLYQNYPNPFNPSTTISFDLPKTSLVSLKVFDILGREVASLVSGIREAGTHRIPFHADRLASGVYYYRLTAVDPILQDGKIFFDLKKLLIVR